MVTSSSTTQPLKPQNAAAFWLHRQTTPKPTSLKWMEMVLSSHFLCKHLVSNWNNHLQILYLFGVPGLNWIPAKLESSSNPIQPLVLKLTSSWQVLSCEIRKKKSLTRWFNSWPFWLPSNWRSLVLTSKKKGHVASPSQKRSRFRSPIPNKQKILSKEIRWLVVSNPFEKYAQVKLDYTPEN